MKTKPTYPNESKIVNEAFDPMAKAIRLFAGICKGVDCPVRSITYRVRDDGETNIHVAYKRMSR